MCFFSTFDTCLQLEIKHQGRGCVAAVGQLHQFVMDRPVYRKRETQQTFTLSIHHKTRYHRNAVKSTDHHQLCVDGVGLCNRIRYKTKFIAQQTMEHAHVGRAVFFTVRDEAFTPEHLHQITAIAEGDVGSCHNIVWRGEQRTGLEFVPRKRILAQCVADNDIQLTGTKLFGQRAVWVLQDIDLDLRMCLKEGGKETLCGAVLIHADTDLQITMVALRNHPQVCQGIVIEPHDLADAVVIELTCISKGYRALAAFKQLDAEPFL